jgi:hypothetical protein
MSNERKDIDWTSIRADYEAARMSLRQLAATYAVSKSAIIEKRNKEQWAKPDPNRPPDNTKGNTRDVNAAMRVHDAIRLYLEERPTWEDIAARTGYGSRGAAHNAVMRELDRCITHDVRDLRNEELYMIQQLQARCYKAATDENNDSWTWAIDRFTALSKRKSELMNLDLRPDDLPPGTTIIREYGAEVEKV